jgi:fibronectin-binding autotransporter adhesin
MKAPNLLLRQLSRAFTLAVLLVFATTGMAWAQETIYVDTGGNDAFDGTAPSFQGGTTGPVRTIGQALSLASAGDVISIEAGTYNEGINVTTNNLSFVVRPDGQFTTAEVTGNLTIDATGAQFATSGTGTFSFTGGNVNLVSGGVTVGNGTVRLRNGVLITRTGATAAGTFDFAGTVNVTYNGTTNVTAGAELPASLAGGQLNVNFATAGRTLTLSQTVAVGGVAVNGNSTVAGTLSLPNGGTIAGPGTLGTVNIADGGTINNDADFTGSVNVSGGTVAIATASEIGGSLNVSGGTVNVTAANVEVGGALAITSGGTVNLQATPMTVNDVSLVTGAALNIAGNRLQVQRNFTRTGGSFSQTTGTLDFVGTTTDGTFSGGPNFTLGNLEVNKTGRTLTVTQNVDITNSVNVIAGTIDLEQQTLNIGTGASVVNNGTVAAAPSGGVVFVGTGTTVAGSGNYTNITVAVPAGEVVTVAGTTPVRFTGILSLTRGSVIVPAGNDLSPSGNSASVVVNLASTNTFIGGAGTFNNADVRYDLSYINSGNNRTAVLEWDTDNIRNLTVTTTDTDISAASRPGGTIAGNVTLNAVTTAGNAYLVTFPTDDVEVQGNVTVGRHVTLALSDELELSGDGSAHTVHGRINDATVAGTVLITGNNVTVTGSASTDPGFWAQIWSDIDVEGVATLSTLKAIAGNVATLEGGELTLGMASNGFIAGTLTLDGNRFTLGSNAEVRSDVTFNNGVVDFAASNLVVTNGASVEGAEDVDYAATTGYLVLNGATSIDLNEETIPNLRVSDDATVLSSFTVGSNFSQTNNGTLDAAAGIEVTLTGAAAFSGGDVLTGAGSVVTDDVTVTLNGSAAVSNLEITGNTTVNRAGSVARSLSVTDAATQTSGDLTLGTQVTFALTGAGNAYTYTAGAIQGDGTFQFAGTAAQTLVLQNNVTFSNLAINNTAGVAVAGTDRGISIANSLALQAGAFDSDAANGTITFLAGSTIARWEGALAAVAARVVHQDFVDVIYGNGSVAATIVTGSELPATVENLTVLDDVQLASGVTVRNTMRVGANVSRVVNTQHTATLVEGATLVMQGNGNVTQAVGLAGAYNLTYNNWTPGTITVNEFPTAANILTLTVDMGGSALRLDRNRQVGNTVLASGSLNLAGFSHTSTGDVTYAGGVVTSTVATGLLTFGGSEDQTFTVPTGGLNVPNNVDVRLNKEEGSVMLTDDLNFVPNAQLLHLDGGILVTGDNIVTLQHGGSLNQGFMQEDEDSFIAGYIRKTIVNIPSSANFAGRVTFPIGTEEGDYRRFDLIFPTQQLQGQEFQSTLTVTHVPENPEGIVGLPLTIDGVRVTGYPDFYWNVVANPRLAPETAYSIEAQAEGFEDFEEADHANLRLIRRADGDAQANEWRGVGQSYANFLEVDVPTVVATGAVSAFNPAGARITYGLSSSLVVIGPIPDQTLVALGDPFVLDLSSVFGGAEGEITYTATSSAPAVFTAAVEDGVLTVTALNKGTAEITVTAVDEGGNVNRVSFEVTATTMVSNEEVAELPAEFAILGNYPNPFNPTTAIQIDLPEAAEVTVEVIDLLGRRVLTIPARTLNAGAKQSISVDGSTLASGVYVYRVVATSVSNQTWIQSGRMTLVK